MTISTRRLDTPIMEPGPRGRLAQRAWIPITAVRRVVRMIGAFADAGQLGPQRETEIGRETGGRI